MTNRRQSETLVCIPCFNSEATIVDVVRPILDHSDADILLVDDTSDMPLIDLIRKEFPGDANRITVLRPEGKLYTGGAKNIGLQLALDEGYAVAILMDSDIIVPPSLFDRTREYFRDHPQDVIVAPAILPYGKGCQYADTLINFSNYLPQPTRAVSRKPCLAGYAFAVNIPAFRQRPCFMPVRIGGDDVLFFRRLKQIFGMETFPLMNDVAVVHRPPRVSLKSAVSAQWRYARSFFTHNDQKRTHWFNKAPLMHLATPRFLLMLVRMIRGRRFADLKYLPLCWYLDFRRAVGIIHLSLSGYRDPANTFAASPARGNKAVHRDPAHGGSGYRVPAAASATK